MSDINLYSQRGKGLLSEEQLLLIFKVIAVVCVVLVLSLSTFFFFLSRDPSIAQEKVHQSQVLAQLDLFKSKTAKYLILIDRIKRIKQYSQNKKTLDKAMQVITAQIPSSVTVSNFSLDKDTMTLSLSALDLSSVGQAVSNFTKLVAQKNILKDLTIEGLVSDEKSGLYVLSLTGNVL